MFGFSGIDKKTIFAFDLNAIRIHGRVQQHFYFARSFCKLVRDSSKSYVLALRFPYVCVFVSAERILL